MSIQDILNSSFAMENNEDTVNVVDVDRMVTAIVDEVESSDAYVEVVSIEGAIDVATNAMVGLESLEEIIQDYKTKGGMDSESAALLNASVTAIMRPLGGRTVKPMPSCESYDEAGGRSAATGYALEGIGDTIRKIWESIMRMVTKAIDAVKQFFDGTLRSLKSVESAAKAMKEKADKAKGTPKEKELDVSGANCFGEKPKANDVSGGSIQSDVSALTEKIGDNASIISSESSDALNVTKESELTALVNKANGKIKTVSDGLKEVGFTVKLEEGKEGSLSKLDFNFEAKNTKVEALTSAQVSDMAGGVETAADVLIKHYTKLSTDMKKSDSEFVNSGNKAVKSARLSDDADDEETVVLKKAIAAGRQLNGMGRRVTMAGVKMGTRKLSTALSIGSASLKNLENK